MEMFRMLHAEGTTIILVTHEAEVARYAHRTIFVRDGMLTSAEKIVDEDVLEEIKELAKEQINGNSQTEHSEQLNDNEDSLAEVEKELNEDTTDSVQKGG